MHEGSRAETVVAIVEAVMLCDEDLREIEGRWERGEIPRSEAVLLTKRRVRVFLDAVSGAISRNLVQEAIRSILSRNPAL